MSRIRYDAFFNQALLQAIKDRVPEMSPAVAESLVLSTQNYGSAYGSRYLALDIDKAIDLWLLGTEINQDYQVLAVLEPEVDDYWRDTDGRPVLRVVEVTDTHVHYLSEKIHLVRKDQEPWCWDRTKYGPVVVTRNEYQHLLLYTDMYSKKYKPWACLFLGHQEIEMDNVQAEMPRYRSRNHGDYEEVWALKIRAVISNRDFEEHGFTLLDNDGSGIIYPEDNRYAALGVDAAYLNKYEPKAGGYYVVHRGGCTSYLPADRFEDQYTSVKDGA